MFLLLFVEQSALFSLISQFFFQKNFSTHCNLHIIPIYQDQYHRIARIISYQLFIFKGFEFKFS